MTYLRLDFFDKIQIQWTVIFVCIYAGYCGRPNLLLNLEHFMHWHFDYKSTFSRSMVFEHNCDHLFKEFKRKHFVFFKKVSFLLYNEARLSIPV